MNKKVKTEGRLNRIYQDDKIVEYNIAGLSDGWHIVKNLNNNKYCLVSDKELEQIKEDADKWFNYYDIDFYKSVASLVNAFKYDAFMGPVVKNIRESKETSKQTVEHYHLEDMGGHTMAVFGKLANGNFFAGNEELISIYDEDIWPLYHDDEDVTEFEQEHLIKTICPEEDNVSKEDLEEYYSIISQTSFFDDKDLKWFKEKLGLDNKNEVKENKLVESESDDIKQLANDILNWFGSDMGTWFDEIQGNEKEAYDDILFILEDRNEEQIQNLIDTIEEADIDDETAKKVNIATTSSLISRLKNLLLEDNKEVKTESNDYDYIKDRKDIILALEGLKEDLLKIPNVTKVEFDTAQYADGIPGPITLVYFDIKEDGPKYFDEKEILLNRILNTMEINGVNVELDELEDNDTYFYIVAYSTNWDK